MRLAQVAILRNSIYVLFISSGPSWPHQQGEAEVVKAKVALVAAIVTVLLPNSANSALNNNLVALLRMYGINLLQTPPFDDQNSREACGFEGTSDNRTYFSTDHDKISGILNADGTTATEVVIVNSATMDTFCISNAALSNLNYEETAFTNADLSLDGIHSSKKSDFIASTQVEFKYDWKTLGTELSFNFKIEKENTELGHLNVWTSLSGIDFIKLQMTPPDQNQTGLADFMAAGLSGLHIEFVDRGIVELALQEAAKNSGKTPRTARRETYTAMEQYCTLIDPNNQTAIGNTFKVLEDTIVDGGGGKITIDPPREIKFLELLNEQSLINIIPELNISSERIQ